MVTTPTLEKYRQGDFIQYMNNVLQILSENRATQFNVTPQRDGLLATMTQLNEVWQPDLGSELTPEIQALDDKRDAALNGLKMTVDAWATSHYDPDRRNAAYLISDNIAGHGDKIYKMRFQQQTATVNALIKDLMAPPLYAHLNTLGLVSWVAELEAMNTAFDQKYVQRAQATSGQVPGIIVALADEATNAFRRLKSLFEARFSVAVADGKDTTDFQQAENEWSTLTRQYNDAVTRYAGNTGEEPAQPAESEPAS